MNTLPYNLTRMLSAQIRNGIDDQWLSDAQVKALDLLAVDYVRMLTDDECA